jgi:hypothetical protein
MFKMPIHTLLRFRNPGESITHVYAKSGQLVQYDASQKNLPAASQERGWSSLHSATVAGHRLETAGAEHCSAKRKRSKGFAPLGTRTSCPPCP